MSVKVKNTRRRVYNELSREGYPFNYRQLYTYHEVLNMKPKLPEKVVNLRDTIRPPDVSETIPAPILQPDTYTDPWQERVNIKRLDTNEKKYIEELLQDHTPPPVEEVKNSLELIDDKVEHMPIEDVIKINEKLKQDVPLNKEENKLIAPSNSSLMNDIRRGIELKKVEKSEPKKEDSLAEALKSRRKAIMGEGLYSDALLKRQYFLRNTTF